MRDLRSRLDRELADMTSYPLDKRRFSALQ